MSVLGPNRRQSRGRAAPPRLDSYAALVDRLRSEVAHERSEREAGQRKPVPLLVWDLAAVVLGDLSHTTVCGSASVRALSFKVYTYIYIYVW